MKSWRRPSRRCSDLRPAAIIRDLDLRTPIYRPLAAYGHMGREDLGVKWEATDRTEALKARRCKTDKSRQKYAAAARTPTRGCRAAVLQQGGKTQ